MEDIFDPSDIGNWHDNFFYTDIHTQSTRDTQFGGGATGGLDDRFDFIFLSPGFNNGLRFEYIPDTFVTFGNDGNHFNQAVIDGTNTAVSYEIAQALHTASDHYPIYADFNLAIYLEITSLTLSNNQVLLRWQAAPIHTNFSILTGNSLSNLTTEAAVTTNLSWQGLAPISNQFYRIRSNL